MDDVLGTVAQTAIGTAMDTITQVSKEAGYNFIGAFCPDNNELTIIGTGNAKAIGKMIFEIMEQNEQVFDEVALNMLNKIENNKLFQ